MGVLFGAINGLCASVAGASRRPPRSRGAREPRLISCALCARVSFARRRSEPSWTPRRVDGELVQMRSIVVRQKHNTPAKVVRLEIVLYA